MPKCLELRIIVSDSLAIGLHNKSLAGLALPRIGEKLVQIREKVANFGHFYPCFCKRVPPTGGKYLMFETDLWASAPSI